VDKQGAGDLLLVHAAVPQPGVRPRRGQAAATHRGNKDCKDDAKAGGDPEQYKCEYDITIINKLFSKEFAESGSPAYDMLKKKMKLTNDDQEQVAKAIAGEKEDPDQAGQDWVEETRDKVDAWLQ
jgi:ABC-type proline/glycine betaine transport system substrate-binding protein